MAQTDARIGMLQGNKSCWGKFCKPYMVAVFGLLMGAFLLTIQCFAQAPVNATLRGTVKDSSGGSVAGAKIVLTEPATGRVVRQAVSSATGDFEFDELQPSTYLLRCESTGFKSFEARNILLDPGQIRRVDPVLAVGATATQVVVSAGAAVINTESAMLSTTFNAKQNDRSPLVNIYPSIYSLLTTASGVQGGYGTFPVMNGQQQTNESQVFDGIPNDLQWLQHRYSAAKWIVGESRITTQISFRNLPSRLPMLPLKVQCLRT